MSRLSLVAICCVLALAVAGTAVHAQEPSLSGGEVNPPAGSANSYFDTSVTVNDYDPAEWAVASLVLKVGDETVHTWMGPTPDDYEMAITSSGAIFACLLPDVVMAAGLLPGPGGAPREYTVTWELSYVSNEDPEDGGTARVTDTVRVGGAYVDDNVDFLLSYPMGWPMHQSLMDPLTTDGGNPIDDNGASSSYYTFSTHYYNAAGAGPLLWFPNALQDANGDPTDEGLALYISRLDETGAYTELPDGVDRVPNVTALGGFLRSGPMFEPLHFYTNNAVDENPFEAMAGSYPQGRGYQLTLIPSGANYYEGMRVGRYHYFWGATDDRWPYNGACANPDLMTLPVGPGTYEPLGTGMGPWRFNNRLDTSLPITRVALAPDPAYYGYPFAATEDLAFAPSSVPGGREEERTDAISGSVATHPFVSVGLRAVASRTDPTKIAGVTGFPEGGAKYLGTVSPRSRYVNPQVPNQGSPGNPGNPTNVIWSETFGGVASQVWTFRVIYQGAEPLSADQPNKLVGKAPAFVRLRIWDSAGGGGASTVHMMTPEVPANPTAEDFLNGVIYRYDTVLPTGPHSYRFEASDSSTSANLAIFPRRPGGSGDAAAPETALPIGGSFTTDNNLISGPYVNNRPVLANGAVTPTQGLAEQEFTFSVTYRDEDNQRPYRSEIVIETAAGQTITASLNPQGTSYRNGVTYTFSSREGLGQVLAEGLRHYYFRFSDDWGRQTDPNDRLEGETVTFPTNVDPNNTATWLSGPTILGNNRPTLTSPSVQSSNNMATPDSQWTFAVTYNDHDNQAPEFVTLLLGRAAAHAVEAADATSTTSVTVTPADPAVAGEAAPRLLNVVGVWTSSSPTSADTNYYVGGSFDPGTNTITLGTPLPSAGTVYVTYHSTPIDWSDDAGNRGRIPLAKVDPSDVNFADGARYRNAEPIQFFGPASSNQALHPPVLNYYAFEASDGSDRARYEPEAVRPSTGAFNVEMEELSSADNQTFDLSFGGYPSSEAGEPVAPVVAGPFSSVGGNSPRFLQDVVVRLTSGGTTTVLTKGDGATKNDYQVDYALGRIILGAPADEGDVVTATYWWADSLTPIAFNNPPVLTEGRVTPRVGSLTTPFTFSVVYRDVDGINGTPPTYVEVVINGVAFPMTPKTAGQQVYKNGVEYVYTTKLNSQTPYRFHFRASDGYGYAVFDAGTPASRSGLIPISPVFDILGPYINDAPILQNGSISGFTILRNQAVTYSVAYRDTDNDAPGSAYPITWVGDIDWEFNGGIIATNTAEEAALYNEVTLITDDGQEWTPGQFRGQPITWQTGKRVGITDSILDNTATMLVVNSRLDSDVNRRPEVSDQFAILQAAGTVSSIDYTAAAFRDYRKNFTTDALVEDRVQIVTGSARGNIYKVAANTGQLVVLSDRVFPTPATNPDVAGAGLLGSDAYSIHDILVGQVAINPNDNGLVSLTFNNTPEWEVDQFAGLVVQMLTGQAANKSYTILSNTANKLVLAQAAGTILNDNIANGDVARVAGLAMQKVIPSETDYTVPLGVQYRATVPGLGLGMHTAKWMAANRPNVGGQFVPFAARHPQTGSLSGPLVVADVPPGNTAPQLANAVVTPNIGTTSTNFMFSVDYRDAQGDPPGPHDGVVGYLQLVVDAEVNGQIIRRTYTSSVDPVTGGPWPQNVFRTINASVFDGFLIDPNVTPLPPGSHRFHFEASDGWQVVRYPSNPANDPSVVVNSKPVLTIPESGGVLPAEGNEGTTFVFQVMYTDGDNQAPNTIQLRLNDGAGTQVLPMTQLDPSDTNYRDGAVFVYRTDTPASKLAAGSYSFRFEASDPVEAASPTFQQSGPVVRSDNQGPELLAGSVDPESSALAGNEFNYSVRLRDPDGDVPTYVRLHILDTDGITVLETLEMEQVDPTDTSYADEDGVEFAYTGYSFTSSGTFSYEFTASDGLMNATDTIGIRQGPVVNTPPVLSGASLTPAGGLSSELFEFSVVYTDLDNVGPAEDGYVRVVLTRGTTTLELDLVPQSQSGWDSGVVYSLETQLPAGVYSYHFEAHDGLDPADNTPETSGPSVVAAPELRNARVTPAVGPSTTTFSYTVTMANPDGTGPSEIVVIIDGQAHPMTKVNPSDMNFTAGVQYRFETTLEPGAHTWLMRARAAGQTIYPVGQSAENPAQGPTVNYPPVLTNATVTPTFGRPAGSAGATNFVFEVTYSDQDNVAPTAQGYVRVRVSGVGTPIVMTPVGGGTDWQGGVRYRGTAQLPGGQHSFHFEASDGIEETRLPTGAGAFDGPRVSSPPTLVPQALQPGTQGTTATTFTYSVIYRDADNDPPAEGSVKVLIDGHAFTMARQNPQATDYITGVTYVYSTRLTSGAHSYLFQASDGVDLVATGLMDGPNVTASGLTVNVSPNPAQLGDTVTVSGELLPVQATNLSITLTRPSGTTFSIASATNANGVYSTTFVVDEVGSWDVQVTQSGGAGAVGSLDVPLMVQPATLRLQGNVTDMISSPITVPTGDPGAIFGSTQAAALRIVRWDPLTAAYKFYGSAVDFPVLTAGSGFWVRPTQTLTLTFSGKLSDQTQPVEENVLPGWNQIGSGFVEPVEWSRTMVKYGMSAPVSLAEASSRGWVRDYAWGYDPVAREYVLVRGSGGDTTLLNPYRGYWLRAFVPCTLIIQPPVR